MITVGTGWGAGQSGPSRLRARGVWPDQGEKIRLKVGCSVLECQAERLV